MDHGTPSLGPLPATERIQSLDVMRGVAVLGILVMNIQCFAMIMAAYINPTAYGSLEGVNGWVWYLGHLFVDMKFMTIFSMLFGAGVIVMTSRREAAGRPSAGLHYRRMAWLLVFGLLHAHLLWYGDILYSYAMCGFVLYLFRKASPWLLITLGLVSTSVAFFIGVFFGISMANGWMPVEAVADDWKPLADTIQAEVDAYRGSWSDQMSHRFKAAFFFQTVIFLIGIAWRAGGMMLIGMALYKLGVFSAARSKRFYVGLVGVGLLVGIPTIMYGVARNELAGWNVKYSFFFGPQFNYWASILVALGWVGVVMLACKSEAVRPLTRPFAAVGQMALTNYLMQTVLCTFLFYGHGLGRFGMFERWQQLLVVVAVGALQLVVSPLWLRHFRFGPAEWLWRSLSYMKLQPMRRDP